ncbi:MAG: ATP-grasp domain-containing protein [bacterium]|nr:ATP-grasp domain-containing protein [bacterium]
MKNIVYLSPHFPTNFKTFSISLKNAGARVLGIGDEPHYKLHAQLKEAMTEYYKVSDMHNYDELIKAVAYFTYKYGKIHRLDSHSEYWLDTEAKLRDDFNIYGLREKDMKQIRCKSEMKKVYKKLGLRVAQGKVVYNIDEARKFIKKVGYPIVAKPDAGVGANDTYKVHNDEDLEEVYSKISDIPYILEEFITGEIHSYDGLADQDSNPIFCTSHIFSEGVMETVNEDNHIYYYSVRDIPKKLEEIGKKCLKGFNVKERFFHLEFFYTPSGEFVPLEVNIRPPGGLTTDMFNYACDINIFEKWADLVVNGNNELDYERKYFCAYIGRKDGKSYVHPHSDILINYSDYIALHQEMPFVYRKALGDYAYIVRAEELSRVIEISHYVQTTY